MQGNEKKEIYLYVDLIKGIVNDNNSGRVNCPYTNRELGNNLDQNISGRIKWMIPEHMELYEIEEKNDTEESDIFTKVGNIAEGVAEKVVNTTKNMLSSASSKKESIKFSNSVNLRLNRVNKPINMDSKETPLEIVRNNNKDLYDF